MTTTEQQIRQGLRSIAGEVRKAGHEWIIFPLPENLTAEDREWDPEGWERSHTIATGFAHGKSYADATRTDTLDEAIAIVRDRMFEEELDAHPTPSMRWVHERGRNARLHNARLHRGGM